MALTSGPANARPQRARSLSDAQLTSLPATSSESRTVPIVMANGAGSTWLPNPLVGLRDSMSIAAPADQLSEPKPLPPHVCTSALCSVIRVFQTTELLDHILSFLESRDILTLRRTSSTWNQTILQSPKLRIHFFVLPEFNRPAAQFKLLQSMTPGLTIEPGKPTDLGQWIHVSITRKAARTIAPSPNPNRRVRSRSIYEGMRGGLGSRPTQSSDPWPARSTSIEADHGLHEDLFICQPPIVGMQGFVVPASQSGSTGDGVNGTVEAPEKLAAKLSWESGITLGFLAETAQSLISSAKRTEDDARVVFKTIVSFCEPTQSPRKRSVQPNVTMFD